MSAAVDPVTMYTPEGGGRQHVFYGDDQGAIRHMYYDMGAKKRVADPNIWATNVGASNLAAMYSTNTPHGQLHVFYLGASPIGIYQVFEDLGEDSPLFGPEDWYAAQQLDPDNMFSPYALYPATMVTPNGQQHLFFYGSVPDSGIYQVFWDPNNAANPSRPSWQGGKPELWVDGVTNPPALMYTPEGMGQQHVFFRGENNGIYQVFYDQSNPANPHRPAFAGGSPEQWVAGGSGPSVAEGDPVTMYTPNGQQHVFYRGHNNEIYQVFYDLSTHTAHFTPKSWGAGAAGNPATLYTPNGQQHVFYRSSSGNLYHVFYDQNSRVRHLAELWVQGNTAVGEFEVPNPYGAAGDPATMYTPDGQQHVFYRGNDNGIYQVFFDPKNPNNPHRPFWQGGVPERWA